MSLAVRSTPSDDSLPVGVPAWARSRPRSDSIAEAAFRAGGSLTALDHFIRQEANWAGAWRQRLALRTAAAMTRLQGRTEEERALRDALLLRGSDHDPGPAGRLYMIWRRTVSRTAATEPAELAAAVEAMGLVLTDSLGELADVIDAARRETAPAPSVAAQVARQVMQLAPDAEPLAWWAADLAFSLRMQWRYPVPVLSTLVFAAAFRGSDGRRLKPVSPEFERAAYIAVIAASSEALSLATDMASRARRLCDIAPKLRARGADEIVRRLLNEDALAGSVATKDLSRWAARRLFERLVSLDAVRELSGRDSFKIYGL